MSLPILIIFGRNWDTVPGTIVKDLLPELEKRGYKSLCVDKPKEFSPSEIIKISREDITWQIIQWNQVKTSLKESEKEDDLCQMPYTKLEALIKEHGFFLIPDVFASEIKKVPASLVCDQLLDEAVKCSYVIKGVEMSRMNFLQILFEDKKTVNCKRAAAMVKNLLEQRSNHGIVYFSSPECAGPLLSQFKAKGLDKEIAYYFLHSEKYYDNDKNEIEKLAGSVLSKHTYCVTHKEIDTFKAKILEDIEIFKFSKEID